MTRFDSWFPDIDFFRRWVLYNFWLLPRQRKRSITMLSVSAAFVSFSMLSYLFKEPHSDDGLGTFNKNYHTLTQTMLEHTQHKMHQIMVSLSDAVEKEPITTRFQ